jgi:hypothetical protein
MPQKGVRGPGNCIRKTLPAVAILLVPDEQQDEGTWAELRHLRDEISAQYKSGRSAAELVSVGLR